MDINKTIQDYISIAENLPIHYSEIENWSEEVANFLKVAFDEVEEESFDKNMPLAFNKGSGERYLKRRIGYLKGLLVKINSQKQEVPIIQKNRNSNDEIDKIFIVHGHDIAMKESVARFVEGMGLNAVILHEQVNSGRTIIEKFEDYSDVNFAIVLLSPDDRYYIEKSKSSDLQFRARQNVVFELGFFIGRLGRKVVATLYKEDVEIPSDYKGVLYIKYDNPGAWKVKLAKEMIEVGFQIDLNNL